MYKSAPVEKERAPRHIARVWSKARDALRESPMKLAVLFAVSYVFLSACAGANRTGTRPSIASAKANGREQETVAISTAEVEPADSLFGKSSPMTEKQVISYLDANLYWVAIKDSTRTYNIGTAFHMGNGYFLTAGHVVDEIYTVPLVLVNSNDSRGKREKTAFNFEIECTNGQIDAAILKADSTFAPRQMIVPKIYSNTLCPGDTIEFYMNGIHGNPISECEGSAISPKVPCGQDSLAWVEIKPRDRYLMMSGRVFDIYDGPERNAIYNETDSLACFRDVATVLTYNGNSGSPLFVRKGEYRYLAGIACAALTSTEEIMVGEISFQVVATEFGMPIYLKDLIGIYCERKQEREK